MLTSWKLWTVWLSILTLIGILGYGFTKDPKKIPSPLIGKSAPDFELNQLNGDRKISLKNLKGKAVLLNFWASWCQECKLEAKILESFHIKYDLGKEKIKIVGIGIQDTPSKAKNFVKSFGKTYFVGLDGDAGDIALEYGIFGVPESFFIDPEGKIFYKHIGIVSMELLEEIFKPFL